MSLSKHAKLGDFTIEIDKHPRRAGADQVLYVAIRLGWLEIERRGDDIVVAACHREHPHDGAEIFKMSIDTGKIEKWAEYGNQGQRVDSPD